jgi:hypothetical protein
VTWHNIASVALSVDATMLAGLAVTSHNTSATATALFADPTLRSDPALDVLRRRD